MNRENGGVLKCFFVVTILFALIKIETSDSIANTAFSLTKSRLIDDFILPLDLSYHECF